MYAGRAPNGEPIRFLEEVVLPYRGSDCLNWPYAKDLAGRGQLFVNGKITYAYRTACEAVNGPPPSPTHEVAHNCGKGHEGCCNPRHLRWATKAENEADKLIHGTISRGEQHGALTRGERNPRAKLSEENVRQIRALATTKLQREIAAMFGITQVMVSQIIRRKSWSHI